MIASSVHWSHGRLIIYVTAGAPVDAPAVVRMAQDKARLFLGKEAKAMRIGPRRRTMSWRRAYTYAFVALTHEDVVGWTG